MGIILYLISLILQILLVPVGVIFGLFKAIYHTRFIDGFKKANAKFRKMAIGTDIFGNVYAEELFDAWFITSAAVHTFGNYGETISAVLGHNQIQGTLTRTGKLLVKILDLIEKDHCIKAISFTG